MSSSDEGNGHAGNTGKIPHEALIDELVITFDRADGSMKIAGRICNHEVALDMCHRAARHFETQIRLQAAMGAKQAMQENERVRQMLERAKHGGG